MPDKGYGYTWEDDSRQPMLIITTAVLIFCSTITVALRLYCRLTFVRHVGIDDKFMVGAWLFAAGLGIQNVLCVYWGTGRHTDTLDVSVMLIPTFKHCGDSFHRAVVCPLAIRCHKRHTVRYDIRKCLPWKHRLHSRLVVLITAQILLLSQIEVNAAIISASAPALRPLIIKTFVYPHTAGPNRTSEQSALVDRVPRSSVVLRDRIRMRRWSSIISVGTKGLVRLLHVALEVQVRNQYWALKRWVSKGRLRQGLKKTVSRSREMRNMGVRRGMRDRDGAMYAMDSLTV
ncbi:hypothetical protein IG631_07677 [Alternaria alternata]|nr:hypothetical protein IG631_07677 [Alternaria alternata]